MRLKTAAAQNASQVRGLDREIGRLEVELPGDDVGHVGGRRDEQQPQRGSPRPPNDEDQGKGEHADPEGDEPDRCAPTRSGGNVSAGPRPVSDSPLAADLEARRACRSGRGVRRRRARQPRQPEGVGGPRLERHAVHRHDHVAALGTIRHSGAPARRRRRRASRSSPNSGSPPAPRAPASGSRSRIDRDSERRGHGEERQDPWRIPQSERACSPDLGAGMRMRRGKHRIPGDGRRQRRRGRLA